MAEMVPPKQLFYPVAKDRGQAAAPVRTASVSDDEGHGSSFKITIVGIGSVGMACAYSLLQKGLVGELVLADVMKDKLKGEVMDLQHGGAYQHGRIVECDDDYEASRNSDICIIAAGVRQQDGETRLQLADRNRDVLKHIIPPLVAKSPNTVILMVSNPVDIMTYIAWQLSGLPANRVLGSGTFLDSSRFRTLIGQELDVNASSVHAWIVGEHGDSSVPVWSSVNIAGVHLDTSHSANFDKIHERVVSAAYDVIKLKGYTNWAIGSAVSTLCGIILQNQQRVVPVSTYVKGVHGIDESVFLSLPCVLGSRGVERILHQPLDDKELQSLQSSAKNLWAVQKDIKF